MKLNIQTKKELLSDCFFDGLRVVCKNPESLEEQYVSIKNLIEFLESKKTYPNEKIIKERIGELNRGNVISTKEMRERITRRKPSEGVQFSSYGGGNK